MDRASNPAAGGGGAGRSGAERSGSTRGWEQSGWPYRAPKLHQACTIGNAITFPTMQLALCLLQNPRTAILLRGLPNTNELHYISMASLYVAYQTPHIWIFFSKGKSVIFVNFKCICQPRVEEKNRLHHHEKFEEKIIFEIWKESVIRHREMKTNWNISFVPSARIWNEKIWKISFLKISFLTTDYFSPNFIVSL
jgi:hypothetical protein